MIPYQQLKTRDQFQVIALRWLAAEFDVELETDLDVRVEASPPNTLRCSIEGFAFEVRAIAGTREIVALRHGDDQQEAGTWSRIAEAVWEQWHRLQAAKDASRAVHHAAIAQEGIR